MMILLNLTKDSMIYIVALALVLFIAGFVLIYVFVIRRTSQRKTAKELEKRYKRIHTLLVEDIEQFIARLEYISNQNLEYIQYHEKYVRQYQEILQNNDRNSYVAISGLNSTLSGKKLKKIKNLINSTKTIVIEFDRKVMDLYNELNNLLQKDEEFHQEVIKLQRIYRDIKEKYTIHEGELKIIHESFEQFFTKIDQMFLECEELTSAARYEEANEKLPLIEQVLNALNSSFDQLPIFCVRVSKVIPKKMDEILVKYEQLQKENCPLHHLKINSKIETHRYTLDEVKRKLSLFDLTNVQNQLDIIDQDIMMMFKSFDDEQQAKIYFDQNSEKMYANTYELEKEFMKIKRKLPTYKDVYLIKDKYLEKIEELSNDIDNIALIKRDLDTFVHSSIRQPYSIIVMKMNDMSEEMQRIREIITDFNKYLVSLKNDAEDVYKKICDYFIKLKNAQCEVRNINVPDFSNRLKNSFDRSYAYLEEVGDIMKIQPLDVQRAIEILNYAEEIIDPLLKEVEESASQRKYAEDSIVYANQYRQGFLDCKYSLNNAVTSFFEGDFTRTIDETVAIIKKMRPDVKK